MSKPRKEKPDRSGIITGLARLTGRADPSTHGRDHLGYPVPPSRQGRRGLTSHHDPAVITQLKELALDFDSARDELREATIVRTKSGIEFAFEADFHNPSGPPVLGAISLAWEP